MEKKTHGHLSLVSLRLNLSRCKKDVEKIGGHFLGF
jgi:hypothetical protein